MTEYRLDDLARVSGVSARNIRAYRERGLLDAPRRQGRSALYDDYHLAQLKTINQLLRKGYNSAHIAEFFARMREGHDLAAILGVRQAVLGGGDERRTAAVAIDVRPDSDEAARLVAAGLAELAAGRVVLVHQGIAEIVTRSADQGHYIQMILRVVDSVAGSSDRLADALVSAMEESITARYGPDFVPKPSEMDEVARLIEDYRELGIAVVTHQVDKAVRRHMVPDTVTAGQGTPESS